MKKLLLSFLVLTGLLFAQKQPFSIDALYKIKSVNDIQIAPDVRKVAFVLTSYQLKKGTSNSDIYLMDLDGSHLRRLTQNPAHDYHPRWSPDGKKLLFVSDRKEGAQTWILPVNGGEPYQLTHFSTGTQSPEWVGRSGKIIFASSVFPECGANSDCNKRINDSMKDGPIQAHLADHLLFRHWTFYKDGHRTHLILFDPEKQNYRDVTPGNYDYPPFWGSFTVSPDGRYVCVEAKLDSCPASSTNNDLFLFDLQKQSAPENLTKENKAFDGAPVFSPDGRYIAYQTQKIPRYESDKKRLAVYDLKTHTHRILTKSIDNWTDTYHWGPKSRFIYFRVHERGHFPLYRYDLKKNRYNKVADVKTIYDYAIGAKNKWALLLRSSINQPVEIVRVKTAGRFDKKKSQRLTFFNKTIEDSVDIRPHLELWIPSPTGVKIHTFVVTPHDFDPHKKYPLILNVHGGPQYQWADAFRGDWQVYPGAGYLVAFPNPHGSTGYGQAFTSEISKDWNGEVFTDIKAVTDSLAKLPFVDSTRMGAMGWSWGGYAMMWLEGHTTRFKALASMMGVYDLPAMYGATEELWFPEWDLGGTPWTNPAYYHKASPHNYVPNFKTPCLVITGERDYRVPYTQSLEFFTGLQKMHVPSRLIIFKNDGHWPDYVKSMPLYYNAHLDWFHKYLGGEPAPYDMLKMVRNQVFK